MRLASPFRPPVVLLGLLLLALPAAAQAPAGRSLPPPPDARVSLPPDPAAEPAADAADALGGGSSLTRVGEWPYGPSYAIAAAGETVVSGHGRVLRIEGPAGTVPGREDLLMGGLVRDVAYDGSRVYVATSSVVVGNRGITVVETSPAGSGIAGGVYGRTCVSVALAGPRLYAVVYDPARASYVLLVLDATAPGRVPPVLGEVAFGGTGGGIAARGTTVYVAAGAAGTAVIDAADPAAPAVVRYLEAGSFDRRVAVRSRDGLSLLAVGSGQYAPTSEGTVTLFDLAAPMQPAFLHATTFESPVEDVLWNPTVDAPDFFALYVAASTSGLYTLDSAGGVENSAYTTPANLVPGVTRLAGIASGDQEILVADYYYGTFAYSADLFDYRTLSEGASFAFDAEADAQDPATVYVADGAAGIVRLHAEADGRLIETGRARDYAWNYTRTLAQNATHLYAADGYSGVHVVDKATMTRVATRPEGTVAPYSDVVAVSADGQTLFVRDRQTITAAYSLADPANPVLLWEKTGLDPATYASANGTLYIGENAGANVRVLSLAQPTSPVLTATRPTDGVNVGVVLDGARLYAFGGLTRVSVFDVTTPTAPALLGTATTAGGSAFDARANALYVGGTNGLAVYDATAPGSPVLLATYNDGRIGAISDVEATATDVFLAEGAVGVERLAAQITTASDAPAEAAAELAVAPNPTAGRVAITFSLAEAVPLEVEVLDVLGRRVAVLASGAAAAGPQRLEWDGTGAAGRAVAAGLYVVRVRAGATVQTRSVTVVR